MNKFLLPLMVSASLLMTACTSVFSDVRATFGYALSKPDDVTMSAEELQDFPYTALFAHWTEHPQILIVLGFVDGTEFHWITGDRETLVTQHGRVVRTANLDYEVLSYSNLSADPLRCILEVVCAKRWVREANFSDSRGKEFTRTVVSDFEVLEVRELQLPMGATQAYEVIERGYFALNEEGKSRRQFTNKFWLEADGHVVKSEQVLLPGRSALTLTQAKWVGRDE